MKKSYIKEKMYSGNVCLGTWLFLPSPDVVEIIGLAGLDFVVIDMEHSPITYENTSSMIVAAESKGIAPYVRISELSASHILRTLDTGAHGIQIPHVETVEDARKIINNDKKPHTNLYNKEIKEKVQSGHHEGEKPSKKKEESKENSINDKCKNNMTDGFPFVFLSYKYKWSLKTTEYICM